MEHFTLLHSANGVWSLRPRGLLGSPYLNEESTDQIPHWDLVREGGSSRVHRKLTAYEIMPTDSRCPTSRLH